MYEEIPATHRARLHLRVAEVLERLYGGNSEPHLAELAHHFSLALPAAAPETAIEYAMRAGRRAADVLADEEAVRFYRLAVDILERTGVKDDARRRELLVLLDQAGPRPPNGPG